MTARVLFFDLDGAFMEAEQHGDKGRAEEVRVDHPNLNMNQLVN